MKGAIYAIRSHQTKDIYIGSTIQPLCKRFSDHKTKYKYYINGKTVCCSSYEIIQYGDAYIELIELVEFNEKTELYAREGFHIRTMDCVNKKIAGRTRKELMIDNKEINKQKRINNREKRKQYLINNKEHIKEQRQKYCLNNKEKRRQYILNNREKINEQTKQRRQLKKEKLLLAKNIIN